MGKKSLLYSVPYSHPFTIQFGNHDELNDLPVTSLYLNSPIHIMLAYIVIRLGETEMMTFMYNTNL